MAPCWSPSTRLSNPRKVQSLANTAMTTRSWMQEYVANLRNLDDMGVVNSYNHRASARKPSSTEYKVLEVSRMPEPGSVTASTRTRSLQGYVPSLGTSRGFDRLSLSRTPTKYWARTLRQPQLQNFLGPSSSQV